MKKTWTAEPRTTHERPRRTFSRDGEEGPRRGGFRRNDDERPARRPFQRNDDERPARRSYSRDGEDRPARRPFQRDGEDRPRRSFQRDGEDRPARRPFQRDGEDRPRRSFQRDGEGRPARRPFQRDGEDRPARRFDKPYASKPRADKPAPRAARSKETGEVRLNKFIANSGVCSRREADEYITAGLISVNGEVVTEMGVKVKAGDDIRFNGERLKGEQKVYIVMNKPKDYVTTMGDPHAEDTVMDLLGDKCQQRVYPVGRLDKSTTGVLLFTNDGEMAEQLTHPSYNKKKVYHVFLDKNLKAPDLQQLVDGMELEDGFAQADSAAYVDGDQTQVGLEIHSGRNRIVRRMFESMGYRVEKLDRVYFAGITKKNLKRGQWRFLTEAEETMLKMGSYE